MTYQKTEGQVEASGGGGAPSEGGCPITQRHPPPSLKPRRLKEIKAAPEIPLLTQTRLAWPHKVPHEEKKKISGGGE